MSWSAAPLDRCAGRGSEAFLDLRGNLIAVRMAAGTSERLAPDGEGNDVAYDDGLGVRRYEYGPQGMVLAITEPSGFATQFRYDAEGALTGAADGAGRQWRLRPLRWTTYGTPAPFIPSRASPTAESFSSTATRSAPHAVTALKAIEPVRPRVWSPSWAELPEEVEVLLDSVLSTRRETSLVVLSNDMERYDGLFDLTSTAPPSELAGRRVDWFRRLGVS